MFRTDILLNAAPAADNIQRLLFPVIPALLGVLLLIVIAVIAYLWLKSKPFNLK